jgi:hypothetical protein
MNSATAMLISGNKQVNSNTAMAARNNRIRLPSAFPRTYGPANIAHAGFALNAQRAAYEAFSFLCLGRDACSIARSVMSQKTEKWSKEVTEHDHPFALPPGIFKSADPEVIAAALQHSAEDPKRGSDDAFRTAMSMLDFYINRAGKNLSDGDRLALEEAKTSLRKRFGKAAS